MKVLIRLPFSQLAEVKRHDLWFARVRSGRWDLRVIHADAEECSVGFCDVAQAIRQHIRGKLSNAKLANGVASFRFCVARLSLVTLADDQCCLRPSASIPAPSSMTTIVESTSDNDGDTITCTFPAPASNAFETSSSIALFGLE